MSATTPHRAEGWFGRRGIQDKFALAFIFILLLFTWRPASCSRARR